MKVLLRLVLALVLLLGLFAGYLVIAPAAIDPVAWDPPAAPEMTGVLAPNELLRSATLIASGKIDGPEDVETDAQGRVYAGTNDGKVLRVVGDGVEVFADTGGRPLGLDFAPSGALIVADAIKGLLSIRTWRNQRRRFAAPSGPLKSSMSVTGPSVDFTPAWPTINES